MTAPTAAEWADPATRAHYVAQAQHDIDALRRWNQTLIKAKRTKARSRALRRLTNRHQMEYFTLLSEELDREHLEGLS